MATSKDSSKYKDIISKSLQISSGSPAVYQLRPKEEKFRNLTRKTVGEKNLNKTNKTILLVGETGTGKSAMINALVNYTMGVMFEENIWFEIVAEKKRFQCENQKLDEEEDQCESQTSDVIVYQIFGFEDKTLPFSLTIIDTPGYGDIRGIEQDDKVSQRLSDLFRSVDGVHEIDAVGLVLKASVNRLSDRLKYIFDSVTSLFGKDIEKNIVALITHSNGRRPKDALEALEAANIKCAKDEEDQPVHFLFNNCQTEDRTEDIEYLKRDDEITMKGMNQFRDFLEKTAPQKLGKTVEVLNERIRLTACIQNLQERIQLVELKQTEIQQTEEALKKHEQERKKNEEFTVEVDEDYKEKDKIDGEWWGGFRLLGWKVPSLFFKGIVTCNICEENCHFPGYTIAQNPSLCEVMNDGHCPSCPGRCPASDHVKENWKYVTKTRKVKKTLEDVKEKYEKKYKTKQQNINDLLLSLKRDEQQLHKEKNDWLDEAYQHVLNLEQIALNVSSLSTHVHLDVLIEKMKERGDTEKVKKLEEMKSLEDEGTRVGLRNMFGKLTAAGKAAKDKVK